MAETSIQDILAKYQTIDDNQPKPSSGQSPQEIFNSLAANERQRPARQEREEAEAQRFREEKERRDREAAEAARLEEEKRAREAEQAAEQERLRKEAEQAAEQERRRKEAEKAAEQERRRKEEEEAAERERLRKEEAKRQEEERESREQMDLTPMSLPDLAGDDTNFLSSPDQWDVPISDNDNSMEFGSSNVDVSTPANLSSLNEDAQDLLEDPEYYLEDFFREKIADYVGKDPDNILFNNFNRNIDEYVSDSLSPAIDDFVTLRMEDKEELYPDVASVNPNFLISVPAAALFFPAGMFATYYSAQSLQRSISGDGEGAQSDADMARNIGIVGIVVGVILWAVILTYIFAPNVIESALGSIGLM